MNDKLEVPKLKRLAEKRQKTRESDSQEIAVEYINHINELAEYVAQDGTPDAIKKIYADTQPNEDTPGIITTEELKMQEIDGRLKRVRYIGRYLKDFLRDYPPLDGMEIPVAKAVLDQIDLMHYGDEGKAETYSEDKEYMFKGKTTESGVEKGVTTLRRIGAGNGNAPNPLTRTHALFKRVIGANGSSRV